jgi:hypothetical protein
MQSISNDYTRPLLETKPKLNQTVFMDVVY